MNISQFEQDSTTREHETIISDLNYILGTAKVNNLSPVVQRQISQHKGIEITGKFSTNDSSTLGEMSYVTVLRNPDMAVPYDGLGFAWRKGDGSTYNVYLVDNDALTDNYQILPNKNIMGDGSINSFLMAAKRVIANADTTYYDFKLRITSELGMKLWIVESGEPMVDLAYVAGVTDGGYLMDRGAQSSDYGPSAGSAYERDDWNLCHFGIGVIRTQNSAWYYSDIKIVSIADTFPISLFKLDASTSEFSEGSPFYINWKGWGESGAEGSEEYGVKLYIWNYSDELWETIGEHTASGTSTDLLKTIEASYTDISNYRESPTFYVNIMARTLQAADTAKLYTDYIYMNNVMQSGVHLGNMSDIYINDPLNITEDTVTISDYGNGYINLTEGSIQATSINFPILEVVSIINDGTLLVPGVDYTIVQNSPELAFSTRTNMTIYLNAIWYNGDFDVTYRYYTHGSAIQSLINSDSFRAPGVDNLAKIRPPSIVSIDTLEYRGGLAVENMKTSVAAWINSQTESLEISDLIDHMYSKSANYINLSSLDIRVRSYNYRGTQFEDNVKIESTHTLSGIGAYYTHVNELNLTKLS